MTMVSLLRCLRVRGCLNPEGHAKAILYWGKPLDCDKAGRVLWFLHKAGKVQW